MSLTLHFHPLSSFCHKVLIALYENELPFEAKFVNLGDPSERDKFLELSPFGKMPALRDDKSGKTVYESTTIIEYLQQNYPGKIQLLPADPVRQLEVRQCDRLYDLYLHQNMQEIVLDNLRPEGKRDPFGVERAKQTVQTAYQLFEAEMAGRKWAVGEEFSLADCAAAPALFYANKISPLAPNYPKLAAYLARLMERPSYARALREAEPYFKQFPGA